MNKRHCFSSSLMILTEFIVSQIIILIKFITFGCGLGDRRRARGPQQPGSVSVNDWP